LRDLADVAPVLAFFAGVARFARPSLGRRNVEPVCGNVRLFVGRWRLGRGTGPGIRRFF
jgi:hypothetical protein